MRIILSHFIYFQGIIHVTNVWLPPIYTSKLLLESIWVNFSRERFTDTESFHYLCIGIGHIPTKTIKCNNPQYLRLCYSD